MADPKRPFDNWTDDQLAYERTSLENTDRLGLHGRERLSEVMREQNLRAKASEDAGE